MLALDDLTAEALDKTAHSIAHGVIRLEELAPNYGAERRRMRVMKYRGQAFRGGFHDFTIKTGGVQVFPRLVSAEHKSTFKVEVFSSGLAELDALLGGGLEKGTSALVLGPAGTGKSLLMFQFIAAAVRRGEKAAIFVFDEELGLLFRRARGMGIDLEAFRNEGKLLVNQVDAAELSPGEFAHGVRACVDAEKVGTVVIDSLNGYQAAMPEEQSLILHMHELLQYLNRQGTMTFLTVAQHGLVGDMSTPVDVTYLADTVMLLRYFEASGSVRRAISIIKKRSGSHEDTIREFRITNTGLAIGSPLVGFHGVLRGVPTFLGASEPLLKEDQGLMDESTNSERALVFAPLGRDAEVARSLLREAGFAAEICSNIAALCHEMELGAALAIVTEEALGTIGFTRTRGLDQASAALVRFSLHSSHGTWRCPTTRAAGAAFSGPAWQCDFSRATIPSNHACKPRPFGFEGTATPIRGAFSARATSTPSP